MMLVAERTALLAALAAVLPFARRGASGAVSCDEDGAVLVTAAGAGGGARFATIGRAVLPGAVSLPLEPLARALRSSAGSRVEIAGSPTATAVVIDGESTAARKYTFAPADADDAPEWPDEAAGVGLSLPAAAFRRLVDQSVYAADRRGRTSTGWATGGLELTLAAGRLTLAATDAYRLAVASAAVDVARGRKARFLLPEAAGRAWATASRKVEVVKLLLSDTSAAFEAGPLAVWTGPLAGSFPAWAGAAPEPAHRVALPAESFRAALRGALAVADPEQPLIHITTRAGGVTVGAAAGRSRFEGKVAVPRFAGPAANLPLDGRRLLEAAAALDAPGLTLAYDAPDRPVRLAAGPDSWCMLAPWIERERRGDQK